MEYPSGGLLKIFKRKKPWLKIKVFLFPVSNIQNILKIKPFIKWQK